MQTSRLNHLIFPPTYSPSASPAAAAAPVATPQSAPVDAGGTDLAPAKTPGVIYTGSGNTGTNTATADSGTDISKLPLENLLELGKSKGVFTKITYNKDGQMAGNTAAGKPADFVSAAVSTMRDFEDGVAALKGSTPATGATKAGDFWSSHLKQAAAKLNVFA